MKERLKKVLLATPGFQSICRLLTRKHVRTLMYHRFTHQPVEDERFVSSATLEQQLQYIKRFHHHWTPDCHLQALRGERRWQSCPVVITVDDGYRDFYEVAFPVFSKFGGNPMLFVTTNFVAQKSLLWWDRLRLILQTTKHDRVTLRLAGKDVCFSLNDEQDRHTAWNQIADHCRFMSHSEKESLIDTLAEQLAVAEHFTDVEPYQASTWDEIEEMSEAGILIGAHTLNHPILSRLPRDEAQKEISESKRTLEDRLNHQINWFCYPQGGPADYTEETKELVANSGFVGCYVAYQSLEYDGLTMPRYCITADMKDFIWCLCGAEYLVLRLRKLLGKPADLGDFYWQGSDSQPDKNV